VRVLGKINHMSFAIAPSHESGESLRESASPHTGPDPVERRILRTRVLLVDDDEDIAVIVKPTSSCTSTRSRAAATRLDQLIDIDSVTTLPAIDDTWPPAFLVATVSHALAPVAVIDRPPLARGQSGDLMRVLLVDDEEDAFILARDLLRRATDCRFRLEWADSFEAGLELLGDDLLSVCLVDYQLGARTGLDFVRAAQAMSSDVPLILMTGRGDRAVDSDAIEAGAADYLDKAELTPALLERSIRYAIERASALRLLRESEELHRSIIASVSEGLLVLSADGRVLAANPAAGRILQIVPAALVGRYASDDEWSWLDAAGEPLVGREHPLRLVATKSVQSRLVGLQRRDRTTRWLEVNAGSMRGVGRDAAFVVSFEDVTESRDAAQRLAQADRVDALDRLAGGIAHDFNNLVTVMRGCVDLLVDESDPVDLDQEVLSTLSSTTDRASDLARQLLDLRGQSRGDTRVFDLAEFVDSLRGIIRQLVGDRIELAQAEPMEPALVRIDPTRLEHTILNLLANSRDAMPDGGRLAISVGIEPVSRRSSREGHGLSDGETVSLTVRDTGQGMDEATLAQVFEPYFSTKGRGRGTGLGLAAVYGAVRDSGGDIRIESAPDAGTTVRILLPRVEVKRELEASPGGDA
jgi:two-component system cell cycle sensor histidine kinase/response regulator CckA